MGSFDDANKVSWVLKGHGIDVSDEDVRLIEKEGFDEGIHNGNWEAVVELTSGINIMLIQEDEYDQQMDNEEPDGWEEIGYSGVYVFIEE